MLGCASESVATTPSSTSGAGTEDSIGSAGAGSRGSGFDTEADGSGGETDGTVPPDFPEPGPPGGDACPQLSCLPCGNDQQCAAEGPFLGETCCSQGDALLHRGVGTAAEAVDIEVVGDLSFLCGGFGVRINDTRDPTQPQHVARAASRCQRIAIGPELDGGARLFWLAHHGDTWVEAPFLGTFVYEPGSEAFEATELGRIEDPEVLFEGIVYRDGFLYAATHQGGLHTYRIGDDSLPSLETVTAGFDNATKIAAGSAGGAAAESSVLYVADQGGGIKVVELSDPAVPSIVATVEVAGMARDVAVRDGVLVVSLGGGGVDVFDVQDPLQPQLRGHIALEGTAQGVDVDGRIIAVAAWTHVALYDRDSLQLLATERVKQTPQFEQDFGVAIAGDLVHVAEWEQHHVLEYRPGLVAPDIWVEDDLIEFDADQEGARAVVVRNRGYLDLDIERISAGEDSPFEVDTPWIRVPPQSPRAVEVLYRPDGFDAHETLKLESNDPDEQQTPMLVPISATASDRLDVGDVLTDEFGFLDPTGVGEVEGLRGHVVVLAYFALF